MRKEIAKYSLVFLTVCIISDCRKSYAPPEINTNHLYLSVDGLINITTNSISSIKLMRSQKLSDTFPSIPELGATVNIMNTAGISYPLTDTGSNGIYVSAVLTLDPAQKYVLSVTTKDGNQYSSDPVTPRQTPPIDSVYWTLGIDGATGLQALNILLDTHDPSNNTRLYRWDFTETWTHESRYKNYYAVDNNKLLYLSPDTTSKKWHCWNSDSSTDIFLGSSAGLSSDMISQAPLLRIFQNDPRMDFRYSLLVRQYALDAPAYDYWALVQKQSQTLGGLFDIQPAPLTGNMHNLKVPAEPVYGYVSASSIQEQRIYINNQQLPDWKSTPIQCTEYVIYPDSIPGADTTWVRRYNNTDPNFTFLEFSRDRKNKRIQLFESTACFDCTYQGGSTIKPPFWQ
jgi:Domain of unknown function (DUF4249)